MVARASAAKEPPRGRVLCRVAWQGAPRGRDPSTSLRMASLGDDESGGLTGAGWDGAGTGRGGGREDDQPLPFNFRGLAPNGKAGCEPWDRRGVAPGGACRVGPAFGPGRTT